MGNALSFFAIISGVGWCQFVRAEPTPIFNFEYSNENFSDEFLSFVGKNAARKPVELSFNWSLNDYVVAQCGESSNENSKSFEIALQTQNVLIENNKVLIPEGASAVGLPPCLPQQEVVFESKFWNEEDSFLKFYKSNKAGSTNFDLNPNVNLTRVLYGSNQVELGPSSTVRFFTSRDEISEPIPYGGSEWMDSLINKLGHNSILADELAFKDSFNYYPQLKRLLDVNALRLQGVTKNSAIDNVIANSSAELQSVEDRNNARVHLENSVDFYRNTDNLFTNLKYENWYVTPSRLNLKQRCRESGFPLKSSSAAILNYFQHHTIGCIS